MQSNAYRVPPRGYAPRWVEKMKFDSDPIFAGVGLLQDESLELVKSGPVAAPR
jgi:hypothetical protein